jgi:hypothetical protein
MEEAAGADRAPAAIPNGSPSLCFEYSFFCEKCSLFHPAGLAHRGLIQELFFDLLRFRNYHCSF